MCVSAVKRQKYNHLQETKSTAKLKSLCPIARSFTLKHEDLHVFQLSVFPTVGPPTRHECSVKLSLLAAHPSSFLFYVWMSTFWFVLCCIVFSVIDVRSLLPRCWWSFSDKSDLIIQINDMAESVHTSSYFCFCCWKTKLWNTNSNSKELY